MPEIMAFIYNKLKEYGAHHGTHSDIYSHALEGIHTAHVYQLSDGGRDGDRKRGLYAVCGCVFVINAISLIPARILKNLWRIKVTDPISCEGWDTGKPFLGVPSKFVVINEDGEKVGTLAELIPFLMLVSNNLSDIENDVEARNNLGVYSKEEIDDAIETATPQDATPTVKGVAKLVNTLNSAATDAALTAAKGKELNDKMFGVGQTYKDVTASRSVNTVFTNSTLKPIFLSIDVSIAAGTTARIYCGTEEVATEFSFLQSGASSANMYAVIGPQEEYRLTGATIRAWRERN